MAGVTHNITTHSSVKNARYSICLKIACIFSKFYKRSNALICIASDKKQWHNLTRAKPKLPRVLPLVAMLKLVQLRSMAHASWIISCLRQRYCVESGGKRSRHSRRMRNPQFYVSDNRPRCWRLFSPHHHPNHWWHRQLDPQGQCLFRFIPKVMHVYPYERGIW